MAPSTLCSRNQFSLLHAVKILVLALVAVSVRSWRGRQTNKDGRIPTGAWTSVFVTSAFSLRPAAAIPGAQPTHLARYPLATSRLRVSTSEDSGGSAAGQAVENDDISSMRAGVIKQELESYGINTKSFLEKFELVEALRKAREQGLKPNGRETRAASSSSSATNASAPSGDSSTESVDSRDARLQGERQKCMAMKASELRKELEERGIATKSFLEKSEFVEALAKARVDGVQRASPGSTKAATREGYAEYKDVEVLTEDSAGPRKRQFDQQQQQTSSNPFGSGAGDPSGGFGGMSGIGDLLKNMGIGANPFGASAGPGPFGGGARASPFGGANPFGGMGDAMGKAQELMKNPKVREILAKAQSNPSIMAKVNECMSNPGSFTRYQNDPEVAELIAELRKYM